MTIQFKKTIDYEKHFLSLTQTFEDWTSTIKTLQIGLQKSKNLNINVDVYLVLLFKVLN